MDGFLDTVTKALWNKNYPRTLIIFNINNVGQLFAGIILFICAFYFPTEGYYAYIISAALIVVPVIGTVTAVLNQEIYEWIVGITHGINAFILIPLYFCTTGSIYGLGLVMFVLTAIQSYVLLKNLAFAIVHIALQNTLYVSLIILAFEFPQYFHNFETPGVQRTLFYIGVVVTGAYLSFLARVFVYVFKMDYERTIELSKSLETANAMDDLTGAFNYETGINILQTVMNGAWKRKSTIIISLVDVDFGDSENNKFLEDLIIVNAFDACRDVLPSDCAIVRAAEKQFLLILPNCERVAQAESYFSEISSQFSLLKQSATIEEGSLFFGCAKLVHGMTTDKFISLAEKNLQARRDRR